MLALSLRFSLNYKKILQLGQKELMNITPAFFINYSYFDYLILLYALSNSTFYTYFILDDRRCKSYQLKEILTRDRNDRSDLIIIIFIVFSIYFFSLINLK